MSQRQHLPENFHGEASVISLLAGKTNRLEDYVGWGFRRCYKQFHGRLKGMEKGLKEGNKKLFIDEFRV
jgi:hypothetical protein